MRRLAAVLEALVPREDTRQQARLAQDLKSVAGAEDQSAASDELAQRLDKDRFRRDMGGVEEAYAEVYRRLVPARV